MPSRRKLSKAELAAIIAEVQAERPPKPTYPASLVKACGHWDRVDLREPEMPRLPYRTVCHQCRMELLLFRPPENPK